MPLAPPAVPSSTDAPPDIRIQRGLRILQLSRERKVQRSPDRRAALIQRGRLILQRFRHREQQLQQLNRILDFPIQMTRAAADLCNPSESFWLLTAIENLKAKVRTLLQNKTPIGPDTLASLNLTTPTRLFSTSTS